MVIPKEENDLDKQWIKATQAMYKHTGNWKWLSALEVDR